MEVLNKILKVLWKNSAAIVGFILAVVIFKACQKEDQVYKLPEPKVIVNRIAETEKHIHNHQTQVINDKAIISKLGLRIDQVMDSLERYRTLKDSVRIIQIQDTTIRLLFAQGEYKDSVIAHQDTIITAQRYIINNQDTLLSSLKFDLKRVKKQRNWAFVGTGVLSGIVTSILIIK